MNYCVFYVFMYSAVLHRNSKSVQKDLQFLSWCISLRNFIGFQFISRIMSVGTSSLWKLWVICSDDVDMFRTMTAITRQRVKHLASESSSNKRKYQKRLSSGNPWKHSSGKCFQTQLHAHAMNSGLGIVSGPRYSRERSRRSREDQQSSESSIEIVSRHQPTARWRAVSV